MDTSNNTDLRESRRFNLSKGQKYLDKLKTTQCIQPKAPVRRGRLVSNYADSTKYKYYVSVNDIKNLVSSKEELIHNYEKLVRESVDAVATDLIILNDYKKFKNCVYTLNAKSGLSDVLTRIDLLQEEKNIYTQIKKNMETLTFLPDNKLDDLYSRVKESTDKTYYSSSSDEFSNLKLRIFDMSELKDKLKKINVELDELETKRDQLNAGTMVEFSFHKKTLELLGI
jgi:hypothetical protein